MKSGSSRGRIGELSFEEPSTAYGAVTPERRSEPCRGIKVLGQVLLATGLIALLLAFGAGRMGSGLVDVDQRRRDARGDQVVAETIQMLAALPYGEVAALDGVSLDERESSGHRDYRVDFAVTAVERGVRIEATLLDARTRLPVRQFVAWRGRS